MLAVLEAASRAKLPVCREIIESAQFEGVIKGKEVFFSKGGCGWKLSLAKNFGYDQGNDWIVRLSPKDGHENAAAGMRAATFKAELEKLLG